MLLQEQGSFSYTLDGNTEEKKGEVTNKNRV